MAKIVNGDNYGSDYPDEKFVENLPSLTQTKAEHLCQAINEAAGDHHPRFWRAVPDDYVLQPGFQP